MNYPIHKTITLSSLALLLIVTNIASAEVMPVATTSVATTTATTTPTTTPVRQETVRQNHPRKALNPSFQNRLTNLSANVSNRLDALNRRIDNVTKRLDTRADKMSSAGIDVTAAKAKIVIAKTELAAATADLATIDSTVARFVGSTDPYESWQTLKATYLSIKDHLKAAHKADVEALLILQTATPRTVDVATSTATTTSSSTR